MEVEVVAAGGAVNELRHDSYDRRQQNKSGAGDAAPAGWISRSHKQNQRLPERFEKKRK
jgi:hypothetical protein